MSIKPCITIPIYNHGDTIECVVAELQEYKLPIIIVDDGSNASTKEALARVSKQFPRVDILQRETNGGKGLAMRDAFAHAFAQHFTHAIQVDADGQHDASYIPQFLAIARDNPDTLILANPTFDESAPWIRCWGRKLSTVLIWLQTLSFQVRDGLCGYRLYPVERCHEILSHFKCGERMDFDPSLLVHLVWAGTPVDHIDTPVRYPEGGHSNFRYLRDNVLIAKSHLRLIGGMFVRAPKLLARKFMLNAKTNDQAWSEMREQGSYLACMLMLTIYRVLGRRLSTFLARPIAYYFYLTNSVARRSSETYLEKVRSYFNASERFKPAAHISQFAVTLVDKLAVWNGDIGFDDLNWDGREHFYSLIDNKKGFILLGAHLGNIEIGRSLSRKHQKFKVNALMYRAHANRFNKVLRKLNLDSDLSITPLEDIGSDTITSLQEKIRAGELVTLLADRVSAGSPAKSVTVDFLGESAEFPAGPFLLASMLECPVYTIFFFREADGSYTIHFNHFADEIRLPRKERRARLEGYVSDYATLLESHIRDYPLQWFNFYPFWGIPHRSKKSKTSPTMQVETPV